MDETSQPQGISERMQALMSRAEQEVAEQRQLQAVVVEVREGLARLQEDVQRIAGADTADQITGEFRASTTALAERLDAVVRALAKQQEQIDALTAAVAARAGDTKAVADRIDNAVIALAEALLRPRATPATATTPPPASAVADFAAPPEPEPAEEPEDVEDATPEDEPAPPAADEDVYAEEAMPADTAEAEVEDDEPEAQPPGEPDVATEVETEVDSDVTAARTEPGEVPLNGWNVDVPPEPPAGPAWGWDQSNGDESEEKRRPWWRPGG